jgi:hypothetical protein
VTIRRTRGRQPAARAPIAPEFAYGLQMAIGGRTDPEFYRAPSSSASIHRVGRGTTSPVTAGDPWPGGIGYKVDSSISNVIRAATTSNDPDTLIEILAGSWTFQVCVYNPSGSGTNPGFFRSGDTETGSTFVIDNGNTRRPSVRARGPRRRGRHRIRWPFAAARSRAPTLRTGRRKRLCQASGPRRRRAACRCRPGQ